MNNIEMNPPEAAGPGRPIPDPLKRLSPLERFVYAPIGLIWLVFLSLIAVPIMVTMTIGYYISRIGPSLRRSRRKHRRTADGGEPGA